MSRPLSSGSPSPTQASSALPPPNRPLEQLAEMAVELLEGGEQPAAAFLIERADAVPQSRNRGGQIVALALQAFEAGLDLGHLLLGDQIDRADAFALAQHAFEPRRQRAAVGRGNRFAIADHAAEIFRRAVEPLADFLAQPRQAFVCRLALRVEPGAAFARLAQWLFGGARLLGRLAQPRLADRQRVAGVARARRRFRRRLGQRLGLGGDRGGAAGQFGDLGAQRRLAVFEDGALHGGAIALLAPRLALGINRGKALPARFILMRQPVERAPRLGLAAARGRCLGPRRFQCAARQLRNGQGVQRALRLGDLGGDVADLAAELADRVLQRCEPGLGRQGAPRQLGFGRPRIGETFFRAAQLGDRAPLRRCGGFTGSPRRGGHFGGFPRRRGCAVDFARERRQPVALPQLFGGRGSGRSEPGETVPAP